MEGARELEINPIFQPLFSDTLEDPRYYQVYGGRGSGKSFSASIAAVCLTYSKFRHKILYLRQTMSSSEDSTIADVREAIIILGKQADFREAKGVITNIKTGATISFKGIRSQGSATAKLKSLSGITTLIMEEAEEIESFEEFSKIDESIRIKGKPLKVFLIYNPGSAISSWIHKEWFIDGRPNPERYADTMFLHSTYLDNLDNLNEKTIQSYERLKETNPIYYRNTILAEWTLETAGRLYAGWRRWEFLNEEGDTWYGLDFGYGGNDKTACVKITYIEGTYFVEEMFSESKMSINKMISRMKDCQIPFNAKIYCDSAMPLLITEIQKGGFTRAKKCKKGRVEEEIKKVQNLDIVMIGDEDTDLYYHYMTFRRDKKTDKIPHEPDILAALRYGIRSHRVNENWKRDRKRSKRPARRKRKGFL